MVNVALVVLDTLRKDKFDQHFDWLPGVRFENTWSTSHYTIPAHGSLFTGRYPSETGVHAKSERFDYPGEALAEKLRDNGFTTRGVSENILLSPVNDFDRGFSSFSSIGRAAEVEPDVFNWSGALSSTDGSGIYRDIQLLLQCLKENNNLLKSLNYGLKLKRGSFDGIYDAKKLVKNSNFQDKEFLFLNLMQAHGPYNAPNEYRTVNCDRYSPAGAETLLGGDADFSKQQQAYNDCIRYLSDGYKEIFTLLQNDFDYIFTVSDHGELFGEHGAKQHWHGVYPELTHVPLIISHEDLSNKSEMRTSSLLDVHATIQHITGINGYSRGSNLLDEPGENQYLVEYHGLRHKRIDSLIEDGFDSSQIEKYDSNLYGLVLSNGDYGYQTVEGFQDEGISSSMDFLEKIELLRLKLDERKVDSSQKQSDDHLRRQLEYLGYA